jgi:NTP pyrophosphatase (non-canonical NTP hydrolase)
MRQLDLQQHSVDACREVFGEKNMLSRAERILRFAEESAELLKAVGLSYEQLCAIIAYEYFKRDKGEVSQEIAGVQTTLYGLANVFDVDVRLVSIKEIDRILANKDKIRAKHNAKPAEFVAQRVA